MNSILAARQRNSLEGRSGVLLGSTSVKVPTKEEKKALVARRRHYWNWTRCPRAGLDNLLLVVECRSYLDSRGVALRALYGKRTSALASDSIFLG